MDNNDHGFSIRQNIEIERFSSMFRLTGRIEIPLFLGNGQAETLRSHLLAREDWALVLNAGNNVYEIPRRGFEQLSDEQRTELEVRVLQSGRSGFQYRYEAIRVSDEAQKREQSDTLLDHFLRYMTSQEVLAILRAITGNQQVNFVDGQATAYSTGHFLTRHDDNVADKNRQAAYVFGLTPHWRAEWGGLLLFHGSDENIETGFTPTFGALRLFAVPSLHSVSYVTPFAEQARLSVTGWLRSI